MLGGRALAGDQRGESEHGRATGADGLDRPLLARRLEGRDHAGANQRRFADTRRPDHAEDRLLAKSRDDLGDLAVATEEAPGVSLAERVQAGVGALAHGQPAAALLARGQGVDGVEQRLRRRPAAIGHLLQASIDDGDERAGKLGSVGGQARHRVVERLRVFPQRPIAELVERVAAREHAVQDDADGPDVSAAVDRAGAELLGGHVRRGSDQHAVLGWPALALELAGELRERADAAGAPAALRLGLQDLHETEVEDFDLARRGEQDVVGLQIAMDDAVGVGAHQRANHRRHQVERPRHRDAPPLAHDVLDGLALEILEHHVRQLAEGVDLVDDDDVFVGARGGRPRLRDEARGQGRRCGDDELDRDATTELGVTREVHPPHAAAAELANELVVADHRAAREVDQLAARATTGVGDRSLLRAKGRVE